jgi:hypothetical protein
MFRRHGQVIAKTYTNVQEYKNSPSFSAFIPPCIFAPCSLSDFLTMEGLVGDCHSLGNACATYAGWHDERCPVCQGPRHHARAHCQSPPPWHSHRANLSHCRMPLYAGRYGEWVAAFSLRDAAWCPRMASLPLYCSMPSLPHARVTSTPARVTLPRGVRAHVLRRVWGRHLSASPRARCARLCARRPGSAGSQSSTIVPYRLWNSLRKNIVLFQKGT